MTVEVEGRGAQVRRAEQGELAGAQTDPLLSFRPHPCGVRALDAQFEAGKLVLYTGCENGEVAAWEVQATRSRFRCETDRVLTLGW